MIFGNGVGASLVCKQYTFTSLDWTSWSHLHVPGLDELVIYTSLSAFGLLIGNMQHAIAC